MVAIQQKNLFIVGSAFPMPWSAIWKAGLVYFVCLCVWRVGKQGGACVIGKNIVFSCKSDSGRCQGILPPAIFLVA